ncbi:CACTA en-spm transposon protein [Cucumis melo var. makuwa]|uniref:CACTA en-spm transposon protein n=1 Tax=Cucumis melo var. makuwa TaxID=1194695 RepID=A0A5D3BIY8_CUCMM|nr:CACTA en-spm transposon protein [Cucumis melo var. makuwa]TYJ98661.1 CACTA en-spm transposon protein [Cucumis melo var. makuwa]
MLKILWICIKDMNRHFPERFQAQVLELREPANLSDGFFSLAMEPSFDVRCYNGCIVGEVEDVQNDHINVLEIVVSHQVDDHIEDDTLCRTDVDPTIVERSVVRHVTDDFIDDRLFVLDFNDQAMNRFIEHQMLTMFKEFWADCHRHFKKYSDLDEARANLPNALVGRHETIMNKAARQKQPYNHSSGSKSFLQRQYELVERKGESIDCVELFRETHIRAGRIKCWNSNSSLPQRIVSHSLRMRYAIRYLVDNQAIQKALVGDPSRRPAGRRVRAVRQHLVRSPHKKRLNYKLNLMKLWNGLKCKIEITKH